MQKTPQYTFEAWLSSSYSSIPFDGWNTLRAKARDFGITEDEATKLCDEALGAKRQQFDDWISSNPEADAAAIHAKTQELGLTHGDFFMILGHTRDESQSLIALYLNKQT
jgi:hypothetical protein